MDHYKVLGLSKNASKDEIKEAFRNLAMKLHPDKHSQSPNAVRDSATLRFKQVSEAYEVLIDDRKRADYNLRRGSGGFRSRSGGGGSGGGGGGGYGYNYDYYYARHSSYRSRRSSGSYAGNNFEGLVSKLEIVLRFLTTRAFLLNLAFAGALVGGTMIIDTSRDALWKQRNSGKSFEEAMEIIENAKEHKDKK